MAIAGAMVTRDSSLLRRRSAPRLISIRHFLQGPFPCAGTDILTFHTRSGSCSRLLHASLTPDATRQGPLAASRGNDPARFRCLRDTFRHAIRGSRAFVLAFHAWHDRVAPFRLAFIVWPL